MFLSQISDTLPPPEKRRRFDLIVLFLGLIAAIVVALQYTDHALLPARKTDTLWGVLTGIVVAGLYVHFRWSRAAARGEQGVR